MSERPQPRLRVRKRLYVVLAVLVLLMAGAGALVALHVAHDRPTAKGPFANVKTGPGVAATTINLGVLTDESGPFANSGRDVTNGQQLFWDAQNARGGVCGRSVKLVVEDSGSNTGQGVQQYAGLKSNTLALQQIIGSPLAEALREQTQRDQVLAIPEAWTASLTDNPYYVVVGATYDIEMADSIDYMLDQGLISRGSTVLHIYDDSEYGQNALAGAQFLENQGKVHLIEQRIPTNGDPYPQISGLDTEYPGAVLATVSPLQLPEVAKVFAGVPIFGNNPSYANGLVNGQSGSTIKSYFHFAAPYPSWSDPAAQPVKNAYVARYGQNLPSPGVLHGWATAKVMSTILTKACADGELTREGLLRAKQSLTNVDTDGLLPPLNISSVGQPSTRAVNILRPSTDPGGTTTSMLNYQGPDAMAYKRS